MKNEQLSDNSDAIRFLKRELFGDASNSGLLDRRQFFNVWTSMHKRSTNLEIDS
jgi:hypothetical protein